jgi:hypothetical protein
VLFCFACSRARALSASCTVRYVESWITTTTTTTTTIIIIIIVHQWPRKIMPGIRIGGMVALLNRRLVPYRCLALGEHSTHALLLNHTFSSQVFGI